MSANNIFVQTEPQKMSDDNDNDNDAETQEDSLDENALGRAEPPALVALPSLSEQSRANIDASILASVGIRPVLPKKSKKDEKKESSRVYRRGRSRTRRHGSDSDSDDDDDDDDDTDDNVDDNNNNNNERALAKNDRSSRTQKRYKDNEQENMTDDDDEEEEEAKDEDNSDNNDNERVSAGRNQRVGRRRKRSRARSPYKCNKCGKPKKGHSCIANDRPSKRKRMLRAKHPSAPLQILPTGGEAPRRRISRSRRSKNSVSDALSSLLTAGNEAEIEDGSGGAGAGVYGTSDRRDINNDSSSSSSSSSSSHLAGSVSPMLLELYESATYPAQRRLDEAVEWDAEQFVAGWFDMAIRGVDMLHAFLSSQNSSWPLTGDVLAKIEDDRQALENYKEQYRAHYHSDDVIDSVHSLINGTAAAQQRLANDAVDSSTAEFLAQVAAGRAALAGNVRGTSPVANANKRKSIDDDSRSDTDEDLPDDDDDNNNNNDDDHNNHHNDDDKRQTNNNVVNVRAARKTKQTRRS